MLGKAENKPKEAGNDPFRKIWNRSKVWALPAAQFGRGVASDKGDEKFKYIIYLSRYCLPCTWRPKIKIVIINYWNLLYQITTV